jgi:hypothetical protein
VQLKLDMTALERMRSVLPKDPGFLKTFSRGRTFCVGASGLLIR